MSGRSARLMAAAIATLALGGCGDDSSGPASYGSGSVIVSAASSLQPAFEAYAEAAGIDAKQSFAGSDALAAQIRQGVRPDLYAAADTTLPDALHAGGLVGKPVAFATNELVLAVPAESAISSIADLGGAETIAIGAEGVPVGDYTRAVLDRLPSPRARAILANVRSEEPDVAGIVGKLTEGAVDAGFVYITDVIATGGALRAIHLPAALQPRVTYSAAVVDGARNPEGAGAFLAGLLDGDGARALHAAGFGPPPQ